jgi:hypothetical protein
MGPFQKRERRDTEEEELHPDRLKVPAASCMKQSRKWYQRVLLLVQVEILHFQLRSDLLFKRYSTCPIGSSIILRTSWSLYSCKMIGCIALEQEGFRKKGFAADRRAPYSMTLQTYSISTTGRPAVEIHSARHSSALPRVRRPASPILSWGLLFVAESTTHPQ